MTKNEQQELVECKKCGEWFAYTQSETMWDNSGYGYSVKLTKCKHCGCPYVIKYESDRWMKEHRIKKGKKRNGK